MTAMTRFRTLTTGAALVVGATVLLTAQSATTGGLDPESIKTPLADMWRSYSGDYTGRRFSALKQITQANVKNLTLAWVTRLSNEVPVMEPIFAGPRRRGRPPVPTVTMGGEGDGSITVAGQTTLKGAVLAVDGVLYVTAPDNVWALDAHDGHDVMALFLEDQGRDAHRQPRRRDVAQLPLLRHPGRLLRVARRAHRSGALAQGDCQLRAAVLPDVGAGGRRQPRDCWDR